MRCLWLTLADPEPPHRGQFIYSGGLIDALAQDGAYVEVLGLSQPDSYRRPGMREGRVTWWLTDEPSPSHWASACSHLPYVANRCRTPAMRRQLQTLLDDGKWDSIIFDGLSAAWALGTILRKFPEQAKRPRLVYVSHNHEESMRKQLIANQADFVRRQMLRVDGAKTIWLERSLVSAADLMTAITPDDRALYRQRCPEKPIEVVTPGYRGRSVPARRITGDLPRRAVIVGNFDWIAKRMNLQEFIDAADARFAEQGIELEVVGSGQESFFRSMRGKVAATHFTGAVDSIDKYMDEARIAIVPERSGGGFKLKVLDYIFNRLPILALHGSAAGVPLNENESILLFSNQDELAKGVRRCIDDLDRLNRLQDAAFSACRDQFNWSSRGRQLTAAIEAL